MKRLAGFMLLAAGLGVLAQTVPPDSKPQEKPKPESAAPAPAKPADPQAPSAAQAAPGAGQEAAAVAQATAPQPPAEVKGPEEKGLAFMKKIANREFVATLPYVSPQRQRVLSPGKLQYAWEKVGKHLGKIKDMAVTHTDLAGDDLVMHVLLTCEKGTGEARLTYSAKAKDDLLTGVQFAVLNIAGN